MLKNPFRPNSKEAMVRIGGFIAAVVFVLVVGFVLYKSLSAALFESKVTSAKGNLSIQGAQLQQALALAKKWQRIERGAPAATVPARQQPPIPVLDRTLPQISVLNGTTMAGFAATTADKLREIGYTQITTGNAARQDYKTTLIQYVSAFKSYLPDLKQSLTLLPQLAGGKFAEEELPESNKSDIVIILGKERR